MAITLIVEDGSIVAQANTYASVATARNFAEMRGKVLPTGDNEVAVMLILAMDYIEAKRSRYRGRKTSATQKLSFPRQEMFIDGELFPSDAIPDDLVSAQCQLVVEAAAGVVFTPTVSGPFVIKEKVGPLETEYSESVNTNGLPEMPAVNNFLASLLSSGAFSLTTMRI